MKLRTKIICLFTLLITISFLFFFLTITLNIKRTNHTITESLSTQVIESTAREAGTWLNQRISELRMIAMTAETLEDDIPTLKSYIHGLNSSLGNSFGNTWGTLAIGRTDGLGWVSDDLTIDISNRDYFKEAMTTGDEYVLSTPVISKTDASSIILICYPLRNPQQETIGFLNGAVSLNKLTELVKQIDFYDGTSWIMSSDGIPYTSPETYPDSRLLDELSLSLSDTTTSGTLEWKQGTEDLIVFFTAVPSVPNWFLCTAVSRNMLMKDTHQLFTVLLTAWIAVVLLSILCCIFLSRSITRPVQKLTETMSQVEQGQVHARFTGNGKDEISILGHAFNRMLDRLQQLMVQIRQEEEEKRKAEFQVLQAQINPHFLYNTLDTLQWKAYDHDDDEMVNLITALSSFFRISLSNGQEVIPLSKEVEHIENYLYIQQVRFTDTLSYEIRYQVDSSLHTIVKLTLQPLVENAIQHGIKPKLCPCHLTVSIVQEQEYLILTVSDTGVGISKEKLQKLQRQLDGLEPAERIGLMNVHKRLQLMYGKGCGLSLDSELGEWTRVTVRIPARKETLSHVSASHL